MSFRWSNESTSHPPKQIGRRNATSWRRGRWRKRSLVRSEGKARRSEFPGKVFQWKLAKLTFTCRIVTIVYFWLNWTITFLSVTELVSLQVTSHNWLSTYNRWCRTILLNWRCKIPANSSNITAWWILCKSAWFERCTNIGNIYPWTTTQDATSSTLDLVYSKRLEVSPNLPRSSYLGKLPKYMHKVGRAKLLGA